MKGNKTNHKKKYLRSEDFENWLITQWTPFKENDLPCIQKTIARLATNQTWIIRLLVGLFLAILASALAVIFKG